MVEITDEKEATVFFSFWHFTS